MATEPNETQKVANEAKAQENKAREAKMREKQKVVESAPRPESDKRLPADEAKAYLEAAGWLCEGSNEDGCTMWQDPSGMGSRRGRMEVTGQIPTLDHGEPVPLRQMVVPPCSWSYPMQEACGIQRARDKAEARAKAVA